jgi:hypothetical protein
MISAIAAASRSGRGPASLSFRACLALLLASQVSPALARPRSGRPARVGVCEAMERPEHFRGRTVTIEGHAIVDTHGLHLLEPGCDYEIELESRDGGTRGARQLDAMMGRMRGERIMAILRATGEVVYAPPYFGHVIFSLAEGPYIDLDRVKILSRQSLSRQEWRRYREWLDDPRGDPFE